MQGADTVNVEIGVGFDQPFESRWFCAEQAGRVVLFAALGGLFSNEKISIVQDKA
jgi:hypothetical protein